MNLTAEQEDTVIGLGQAAQPGAVRVIHEDGKVHGRFVVVEFHGEPFVLTESGKLIDPEVWGDDD